MLSTNTIADAVYENIRKDIVELRLKPGEKISESQLAKKYNVSRAPVRDAVRKLQQEKLVLVRPQVGTIVSPISLEKAKEICQVRLLLEPYAARVAARKIEESDIRLLGNHFQRLNEVKEASHEKEIYLFETDSLLHKTIWRLCGNEEIYAILDSYKTEIRRIQLATAELADRIKPSEQETKAIYSALVSKKEDATGKAMYEHILNIQKAVHALLQEEGEA